MGATSQEALAVVTESLKRKSYKWLVTGVAGFIGSNLLETLLRSNQTVIGLDNFATGHKSNLDQVRNSVGPGLWEKFHFIEGDIRQLDTCKAAAAGVDFVLHQAALGSVPRSLKDPITTNSANIDGFLNMLVAARDAQVKRFVYAASSSTYGDHPGLPKVEHLIGKPLSPYAVTKYVNELYADVFARSYGFKAIGLRYFNVFGRRQDPNGAYAAVIPKWIKGFLTDAEVVIHGDGETSRDFCYVDNAVQANLLSCFAPEEAAGEVYNIAFGQRTTLKELFVMIRDGLSPVRPSVANRQPEYREFRSGDVRHSLADISKAETKLGYAPKWSAKEGLTQALDWYVKNS